MSTIPFNNLEVAMRPILPEICFRINQVAESGTFLRGPIVRAFEEEWAAYCGQKYCVATGSGTDALSVAAMAMGLDEVNVQANTIPLTALGLEIGGADVYLVDCDENGRIDPDAVKDECSTPALLYGRLPREWEEQPLVDAAHAHGWQPPDYVTACWSFYPTKTLGAMGDAGAVTTNDQGLRDELIARVGRDDKMRRARQITSRMDEMQAAVLRVKLKHLNDWIAERLALATRYHELLPQRILPDRLLESLNHLFVIRTNRRDVIKKALEDKGIESKIHFPLPLDQVPSRWNRAGVFPNATRWCAEVLSLPLWPGMPESCVDEIAEVVCGVENV